MNQSKMNERLNEQNKRGFKVGGGRIKVRVKIGLRSGLRSG